MTKSESSLRYTPDLHDTTPLGRLLWAGECLRAHVSGEARNLGKPYARMRVEAWLEALESFRSSREESP